MLKAPFPWFGGKSRAAHLVWAALGDVPNYVEPFAGSLAVLLLRPDGRRGIETVNDRDGFIANFWRALASDPNAVARYADWPVNETDQHARHVWLVGQRDTLTRRLEGDPTYYDAQIAGWWVWGLCCWIGSGWCAGTGPWQSVDGQLVHLGAGQGVHRKLVHLGDAGRGVHRQRVHLGAGQSVHRKRVHLGDAGRGVHRQRAEALHEWFEALATRLRGVRVCSGDWTRVCGDTPTVKLGTTGVFLDPPYGDDRTEDLYAVDSVTVQADVWAWACARGDDPRYRIVVAGYDDGRPVPAGWRVMTWKANGGYGLQRASGENQNRHRERLWLSPHCLHVEGERDAQTGRVVMVRRRLVSLLDLLEGHERDHAKGVA